MSEKISIKEIKVKLAEVTKPEDPFLQDLMKDERKGVQQLYSTWKRQYQKQAELHTNFYHMRKNEEKLWEEGYKLVGGIDEVGRGPLAGPVIASCVVLSADFYLPGLTDSKKLSKQKRNEYFQRITEEALHIGIGIATADEIDKVNIYEATKIAMQRAVDNTETQLDYLLLDAMKLPNNIPQSSIIKGDSISISIAASSVIAKVTRDRYMEELAERHPQFGFERHMGYGTVDHLQAMREFGAISEHRRSFAPVKEVI